MITTRWEVQVKEYDETGYYYPVYKTNVIVIADTKKEALEKALDRVPKRTNSSRYVQSAEVITFKDFALSLIKENEGSLKVLVKELDKR